MVDCKIIPVNLLLLLLLLHNQLQNRTPQKKINTINHMQIVKIKINWALKVSSI